LRHFLGYHNADKMGYSCTTLPTPRLKTSKSVLGHEGATVWLVAGEGKAPKSYFLASRFVIDSCEPNKHPGTRLPNEVSGSGVLLGKSVCIDGTPLFEALRRSSANFVNGYCEIRDPATIAALKRLA
jgi:hypothetical protein